MPDSSFIATRDELSSVCEDLERHLNELRRAINAHAETLNLHRHLIDRFIPHDLLVAACNEYFAARQQQIALEQAKAHDTSPPAQA